MPSATPDAAPGLLSTRTAALAGAIATVGGTGGPVAETLLGVENLDGHDLQVSASVGVAGLRVGGDTDE